MAFEVVARHLNFARAAEELEVTPTAMSKTIKQLEAQLGVRLFNRTTRSVALTESGTQLLTSLAPALAQIRSSVEQASVSSKRPSGQLRLNTSYVAYAALIEPHLQQFLERYPEIKLDVQIDNGLSDIVGGGFDAGIRLGHALQRDMIAVPMGPLQQLVVVASPQYIALHGTPKTPKELLGHECIRQRLGAGGRFLDWNFVVASKPVGINVQGRLFFNEMHSAMAATRNGCGLAHVFRQFAAADIRTGRLVVVLERYSRAREAFHLYYPSRAQMPGKLRAFVDFIRAANREVPP
jgi:DNA-binding transcriptional LysR family regulator